MQVKIADLLEVFDHQHRIVALEREFDKGTPDIEWMRAIAKWNPKPTLLCGDGRILRNKVKQAVLRECDLMSVILAPGWTQLAWPTFAWKMIKVWPNIVAEVSRANRPTLFEVSCGELKVSRKGLIADLGRQ